MIATFALPSRQPDLLNIYQFVTGIGSDGRVYLHPLAEEGIESLVNFEHCHRSVEHIERIKSFLQQLYGFKTSAQTTTMDDLTLSLMNSYPQVHEALQEHFNEMARAEIISSAKPKPGRCVIL